MGYYNKRVGQSRISDDTDPSLLYNEELTVNKQTGMMSIKTPVTGDIISYDYHTRVNTHINTLYKNASLNGLQNGVIYEITPDDITLPATENILDIDLIGEYPLTPQVGAKSIMISIDLDCIPIDENKPINKDFRYNMLIEYMIRTRFEDDECESFEGMITLDEFNNTVFDFLKVNDGVFIDKLVIHSLDDGTNYRYTLNSILLYINRNNLYGLTNIVVIQQHTNPQYVTKEFDDTGLIVGGIRSNGDTEIIHNYNKEITYIGGDD
jgi:hypothetical protein